jgi:hypothetical protein
MLYRNEGSYLYSEDFEVLFNEKTMSIIDSEQLKNGLTQLQREGLDWRDMGLLNVVLSDLNNEVMNQIL